jgi:hypothetical protein
MEPMSRGKRRDPDYAACFFFEEIPNRRYRGQKPTIDVMTKITASTPRMMAATS